MALPNDTTLSCRRCKHQCRAFGLASRRYVNYGEANEYINARKPHLPSGGCHTGFNPFRLLQSGLGISPQWKRESTYTVFLLTDQHHRVYGTGRAYVHRQLQRHTAQTIFPDARISRIPLTRLPPSGSTFRQNEQVRLAIYDLLVPGSGGF